MGSSDGGATTAALGGLAPWTALARTSRLAWTAAALCIFVPAFIRLPRGICISDSGDFQAACATAGVAHPPGYAGFAAIGWLLTRIVGFVDPARVVSLACAACMTAALMLVALLACRLRVPAWIAACGVILLGQHPLIWQNLVVPEVYAPGAVLLLGAAALMLRYERTLHAHSLLAAALLVGFAISQRPSAALTAPGWLAGWLVIELRARRSAAVVQPRRLPLRIAGVILAGGLPMAAGGVLTYVRTAPDAPYNSLAEFLYVEDLAPGQNRIPTDRWGQVRWTLTARTYEKYMGADLGQMRSKLRWVRAQCFLRSGGALAATLALLAWGTVRTFRQSPGLAISAWGTILGQLGFVLQYRVFDTAADLLPILTLAGLIFLVGLTGAAAWFAARCTAATQTVLRRQSAHACAVIVPVCVLASLTRYSRDPCPEHLEKITADFRALPADSIVCGIWADGRFLWYLKLVSAPRPDVTILGTDITQAWERLAQQGGTRPVFFISDHPPPRGFRREEAGTFDPIVPELTATQE